MKALESAGLAVPMLTDRPTLTVAQDLAFVAWRDLSGERALGFGGCGPIPWRAIDAWAARYAVEDVEGFIEMVQAIDAEFLNDGRSRPESSANPGDAQSPKRH